MNGTEAKAEYATEYLDGYQVLIIKFLSNPVPIGNIHSESIEELRKFKPNHLIALSSSGSFEYLGSELAGVSGVFEAAAKAKYSPLPFDLKVSPRS